MAVVVTDNRTILDQADASTNFNTGSPDTTAFAESTGSIAQAYNIATGQIFYNGTIPNFTTAGNELIYVWSSVVATQNSYLEATVADSSHAQYFTDGTNEVIAFQAGNDREVFKHFETQVGFQCFLFDADYLSTANTNGEVGAITGTAGSLNFASLTGVGAHYTTLSKALGGGVNCYIDIIRYGTEGISVTGGNTSDRGNFLEVCIEDRDTANAKAHGIIREYTGGSYGVQGTLKFGTTGTGDSWFDDDGVSVTYEDRLVNDDKFRMVVEGNTSVGEETHFIVRNSTVQSARPAVTVDISSSGINELVLDGVTFLNLINPFTLPTDTVTNSYTHTVTGCSFTNVGLLNQGSVDLTSCNFSNANDVLGAIELDTAGQSDGSSGLTFTRGTSGHAIYITATGSYDFTGHTYSGYAASDGSTGTEVVYNNSGGNVTINVAEGDTPTIRNGAGANTVVNNNVNNTITVQDADTTAIANALVAVYNSTTDAELTNQLTNGSGQVTFSSSGSTPVYIRVRKSTSGSTRYVPVETVGNTGSSGLNLSVTLNEDLIASA